MFGPDWKEFYTPAEAERQLEGFKFLGSGWYETETDTLLVHPTKLKDGKHKGRYEFWCWNTPGAREALAKATQRVLALPVREDHAKSKN